MERSSAEINSPQVTMENKKTKILMIILAVAVVAAALVWFLGYNKGYPIRPETNIAAGTVLKVEDGRIFITSDIFAGGEFKKVERVIVLNGATQIEKYNPALKVYESVGNSGVKKGYSAQVYFTGPADAETLDASLIKITDPADSMTVENLIKSLK